MNSKPRRTMRSRFEPKPIAGLVLTPRDEQLLADLFLHGVMSRTQIQALYFTSTPRCNARLRQLYDFGLVIRHHLPSILCPAPHGVQAIYSIGKAAIPRVAAKLQMEISEVKQGFRRNLTPSFLEHTLEIVDGLIAIKRTLPLHPEVQLDLWLPELLCRHEYDLISPTGAREKQIFKPDAFVRFKTGPGHYRNYFIEVDLGHTSSGQFLGKLKSHQQYLQSGLFEEIYAGSSFKTLVITTTSGRLQNLLKLIEGESSNLFWFTTFEKVKTGDILGSIWHMPFDHNLVTLV